ncbi:hypothetical protein KUC_0941 [Vreelandella boliviensis LC1]|uniref:Uncharacterized protein n=1 Tax=Vreelandella boliviensis LC1 TaxID=1072583 RepID=A0A7U9C5S2_9GAMM|nr:hypothetical protein KUC_0941 [Halomonas boliviensis LC1]
MQAMSQLVPKNINFIQKQQLKKITIDKKISYSPAYHV